MSASSAVSPELERASTASPGAIMPRSPWLASAGWTNCAGVPVEAKVAAILRATWPLLPMPVTVTRPLVAASRLTASEKRPFSSAASAVRPAISVLRTRRATASVLATASFGIPGGTTPFAAAEEDWPEPSPLNGNLAVFYRTNYAATSLARSTHPRQSGAYAALQQTSLMFENIEILVTRQIEKRPGRQESETGERELLAVLARQHGVELGLERMEMEDVGGGVALLLFGQNRRAPIRALLLLRQLDVQELAAKI